MKHLDLPISKCAIKNFHKKGKNRIETEKNHAKASALEGREAN